MPIGKDPQVVVDVSNDLSDVTDDDGKVQFEVEYGDYVATISKDGYATKTQDIAFRSNHKNFTITLESSATETQLYLRGYNSETDTSPNDFGIIINSGIVEDGKVKYTFNDFFTHTTAQFWLDENAIFDGSTKNPIYNLNDKEIDGYCDVEELDVVTATITLLDVENNPYSNGFILCGDLIEEQRIYLYENSDSDGLLVDAKLPLGSHMLIGANSEDFTSATQSIMEEITITSSTTELSLKMLRRINVNFMEDTFPYSFMPVTIDGKEYNTEDDGSAYPYLEDGTHTIVVTGKTCTPNSFESSSENTEIYVELS